MTSPVKEYIFMQSIFYALDVYFRELNSYLALSRFSIEFFWNKIQSKRETSNINNENKNKKKNQKPRNQ